MLLAAIVALQVVKFCGITYSAKVETAAFSYETFGNKLTLAQSKEIQAPN
jgi:hypothetical protein